MSVCFENSANSICFSIGGTGTFNFEIFVLETSKNVVPDPKEFKYSVLFFNNVYKKIGFNFEPHSKFLKPWLQVIGLPTIPTLPIGARVDNKTVFIGIISKDFDFLPFSVIFLTVSYI